MSVERHIARKMNAIFLLNATENCSFNLNIRFLMVSQSIEIFTVFNVTVLSNCSTQIILFAIISTFMVD